MEFKKLEIKEEGSWVKRTLSNPQTKTTLLYVLIGAVLGIIYLLVAGETPFSELTFGEIIQSAGIGGFLGFFISNSPCARNRC